MLYLNRAFLISSISAQIHSSPSPIRDSQVVDPLLLFRRCRRSSPMREEEGIGMEGEPSRKERVGRRSSAEQTPEAASEGDATPTSGPSAPPSNCSSPLSGLRRTQDVRSYSFQRWRRQMERAWRWGPTRGSLGGSCSEQSLRATMNLEAMANQKRQWYRIKAKARDRRQTKRPTSLFEHFFVVGLHSYANVDAIEDDFAKRKIWESEATNFGIFDLKHFQAQKTTLEPQILFKYPPVKRVAMRENELPAFCFPDGVKARLIERTPSMSDLNEVVFGQEHLSADESAFVFYLKAADNGPLYGVCLHVHEMVQRAPSILGAVSPLSNASCKSSRFLVSAPRCYCLLTRVPYFELHFEMLNSIIAQERLDRITCYVGEMALTETITQGVMLPDQTNENSNSPNRNLLNNWMEHAIPVDTVSGLLSPSVLPTEREVELSPYGTLESHSPESACASEASDFGHLRELDRETRRVWQHCDGYTSETSGSRSDSFDRLYGCFENVQTSPDFGTVFSATGRLHRAESLDSMHSSFKDMESDEEEEYDLSSKHEANVVSEKVLEWAKANSNGPLQIVCSYHSLPLPTPGSEIVFHPLEHLQPIKYCRLGISSLGLGGANAFASAEEAIALSIWTTATICRTMSLESILALFTGVLLEKQVVLICPNLGVLSAVVLSIIPMIRPFQWHSMFLPILPRKMLDFLDAPVPYIVGVQQKPDDIKMKGANLIRINVYKDQVKTCSLPQLPRYKELVSDLSASHARLSCQRSIAIRHPIYRCNEVQVEAARHFLNIMKSYLESLCSDLRSHTITNVRSNNDKVSLLLKDSFIGSFPVRDQHFMKCFVDTQLFSVLSDSRLSRYENE